MPYLAVDGDDVGRRLERLLLGNQTEEAKTFSMGVEADLATLRGHLEAIGACVVFCAGDGLLAQVPGSVDLSQMPKPKAITWSMGLGRDACDAVLALKKAKGLGRDRAETLIR